MMLRDYRIDLHFSQIRRDDFGDWKYCSSVAMWRSRCYPRGLKLRMIEMVEVTAGEL
jgi:hypothetical protein